MGGNRVDLAAATRRQLSVNSWSTLRQGSRPRVGRQDGRRSRILSTPRRCGAKRCGVRVVGVRATLRQLLGNSASTVERDIPGSEPWQHEDERWSRQPEDAPEMDSEMRLREHPPSADFLRRVGLERLRAIRGRSVKPRRWSFGFGGLSRRPLFIDLAIKLFLVFGACISTGPGDSKSRRDRHRDSIRPEASLIRFRHKRGPTKAERGHRHERMPPTSTRPPAGSDTCSTKAAFPAPPLLLPRRLDVDVHLITSRGTPGQSTERPRGVTCHGA
jgi:hypothetical protein